MIHKLIEKSISINRELISELTKANGELVECENEIREILNVKCSACTYLFKTSGDSFSDFIHLFEFKLVDIPTVRNDIEPLLLRRRELKTLIGYSNRVQSVRGFTESYKWYKREDYKHRIYSIRTDCFKKLGFCKGSRVSKQKDLENALII